MTPDEFARALSRDLANLDRRYRRAITKTAEKAVKIIRSRVPVAFGELKESVQYDADSTYVAAPHAEAVEIGSRPHFVPLEPLIAWVKLRGMQGLTTGGQVGHSKSHKDNFQAYRVARQLKIAQENGSNSINDPVEIAKVIQHAIMVKGTKPHAFVSTSLPEITETLEAEINKAFNFEKSYK